VALFVFLFVEVAVGLVLGEVVLHQVFDRELGGVLHACGDWRFLELL